jgi:uridine kinase
MGMTALALRPAARPLPVRLIGVDGHGGSGKSTFAALLGARLSASIVQTDDFAGPYNPADWCPLLIERVIDPLRGGATTLNYPRAKWWETHEPEPVIEQPVTEIMIVEGVGALRVELRDFLSFGVFIDTPKAVCLRRGLERDASTGTPPSDLQAIWHAWLRAEDDYLGTDRPESYADLVVDGTAPFEPVLDGLLATP